MTKLIRITLCLVAMFCGAANAADPIVITGGSNNAISIAVVPFTMPNNAVTTEGVSDVIAKDLYHSGIFQPLPQENMISLPHTPKDVAFRDWTAVNVQYLLIGSLSSANGRLQAEYYLYHVASGKQVFAGSAGGAPNKARALGHYIADQVFEKMTGTRGAFSSKLLYVTSESNTSYTLQMADYDGVNAITLVRAKEPILSPRFSPDGKKVLYVSFESKRPRIYMQDIGTGKREQLTNFEGLNGAPAWSPDGRQMAFVLSKDGNPELYVMDLDKRQPHRLTTNNAIDTEPFWGKDGRNLYFTSDRSGKPQIYKVNVASGAVERVTVVGNYNANPKLSADEKMLVMVHRQDGYRNFVIATQELQTGRVRILSNTNLDDSPTIAPNGTMVIYATRKKGEGVLMLASANGRVHVELPTQSSDVREPSWSPFIR